MSALVATTTDIKVRELQRALYRSAKAEPGRRFHALYDKVYRRDVLQEAWVRVRRKRGAAGIDQVTIAEVEQYGVSRLLDELAVDLKAGAYRCQSARRVWIAKPGSSEQRPLSIPTIRDRIVQTALKIALEPVFEADFLPCSFGFRPKRSAHDALQVLIDEAARGRRWVVETDIASCFEEIPHDQLMNAIEERVCDRQILKLVRAMLRSGVMEHGMVTHSVTGTPQGGVVSPLLMNVYLHRLDRNWGVHGTGVLARYADDLIVMCYTKTEAETALATLRNLLGELGLEVKDAKTRIVHLKEGGEGLDFLGFHHRWVRARKAKHVTFLARWPSDKAMQHARDRIRQLTMRPRLLLANTQVVGEINRFLRGWPSYFRYGNSVWQFTKISSYAARRLAGFIAKRHQRTWRWGLREVLYQSKDRYGLINLVALRIVHSPRPHKPWRPPAECRR